VLYQLSYMGKRLDASIPPNSTTADGQDRKALQLARTLRDLRLERVMGIEPTPSAWKAEVLPLNYTRAKLSSAPQRRLYR
jgi:hypothetical protein